MYKTVRRIHTKSIRTPKDNQIYKCTHTRICMQFPLYKSKSTWRCVHKDQPRTPPFALPLSTVNGQCKAPRQCRILMQWATKKKNKNKPAGFRRDVKAARWHVLVATSAGWTVKKETGCCSQIGSDLEDEVRDGISVHCRSVSVRLSATGTAELQTNSWKTRCSWCVCVCVCELTAVVFYKEKPECVGNVTMRRARMPHGHWTFVL